jgi:DNA-directed RNA polymerase, mitochondrial
MNYVCEVAEHCTKDGRFLQWTSPTGFPVENRYQVSNVVTVNCMSGDVRVRHDIADGVTPEIRKGKAKFSAAPNFVHSRDAAHLIKTVNAAVSEGISDILTVHDCFSCLAPQAERFRKIITHELSEMYPDDEYALAELQSCNVGPPPPPRGTLLPSGERIYFPSQYVKDTPNAFG